MRQMVAVIREITLYLSIGRIGTLEAGRTGCSSSGEACADLFDRMAPVNEARKSVDTYDGRV